VSAGARRRARIGLLGAAAALALAAGAPGPARATGGAYRQTAHGNPATGVMWRPGVPRGGCAQCHYAGGAAASDRRGNGLFSVNDNGLCFSCHRGTDAQRRFPTSSTYAQASHGASPNMTWPGPPQGLRLRGRAATARPATDAGRCVNCHDAHGAKDASGVVPAMTVVRGDALCLRCHDGSRSSVDVASDFVKPYRHGEHGGLAGDQGAGCVACHDPHRAGGARGTRPAPAAAASLAGARRVRVTNGAAGAAPFLEDATRDDGAFAAEYEVCLRCHSGFAGRSGLQDLATLLNPENRSFHPVEAAGKNAIRPEAFARGWRADSIVRCSDCHGSDDTGARGTHGSRYEHLLKKPYTVSTARAAPGEGDLCFSCHAFAAYARAGTASAATRFAGHASHAARQVGCFACHETHGSAAYPALVAIRPDAISSYVQRADGGTCTTVCHSTTPSSSAYTAQYPR
jgi:predicted CXXCH cytochrome family protein